MWLGLNSILRFSIGLRPTRVFCPLPFFRFCLPILKSYDVIFWNVLRNFFLHNSNFPCWLWWAMPDRYVKNFCQQGRNYVNQFGNKGTSHTKWMHWHSEFWRLLTLKFFLIKGSKKCPQLFAIDEMVSLLRALHVLDVLDVLDVLHVLHWKPQIATSLHGKMVALEGPAWLRL